VTDGGGVELGRLVGGGVGLVDGAGAWLGGFVAGGFVAGGFVAGG
jgi:hypothetical protein